MSRYVLQSVDLVAVGVPIAGSARVQSAVPHLLARLLEAVDEPTRETAWASFVAEYSRLLIYVTRRVTPDHDSAMDAYAFVLEKLRENEMRRLRGYAADGRGKFTTWLVVVSRRLCLDFHRQRYGRATHAGADGSVDDERAARRRLVDLTMSNADGLFARTSTSDPESALRHGELERALDVAVTELPAPDRLLLTLRFRDGMSGVEIASLLHFASPFHVYRRLNLLLAALRRRLTQLGVQSSVP